MKTLLSVTAYAARRGVSRQAVNKAIREGRISRDPGGMIDVERADAAWRNNTSHVGGARPRAGRRESVEHQNGLPSLLSSNTITSAWQARLTRLEFEEREGRLVDVVQVRAQVFEAARRTRDLILAIPDRLAPVIAAESDPAAVHGLVTAELRRALDELPRACSRTVVKKGERPRLTAS